MHALPENEQATDRKEPIVFPRWRRGMSTLLGIPTMPVRKLLTYDVSHLSTPERQARGLTIVLSGIEGRGPFCSSLARGFADSWPGAVEIFEWTTRRMFATLRHLADEDRNRGEAKRLADRLQNHWSEFPRAPVYIAGHSGGSAIAAFTLEELAQRECAHRVEKCLLLGAALSEEYDLTQALDACEEIHSFHSPLDIPHLVIGTTLFGTMDRRHGPSAGFRGFRHSHDRLFQHQYERRMLGSWHWGGHMGWTNRVFAAEHLATYLEQTKHSRRPAG